MPVSAENQLKYENYKEQFKRLNRALDNGFNLEAVFIEYAILEDRTESVLRHAEKWEEYVKHRKGGNITIDSKIRYIEKCAENKKDLLHKYFWDELLENYSMTHHTRQSALGLPFVEKSSTMVWSMK